MRTWTPPKDRWEIHIVENIAHPDFKRFTAIAGRGNRIVSREGETKSEALSSVERALHSISPQVKLGNFR